MPTLSSYMGSCSAMQVSADSNGLTRCDHVFISQRTADYPQIISLPINFINWVLHIVSDSY